MVNVGSFAPLHTHTLRANVFTLLVNGILSGRIRPGERLNESHLAKEFDVSRAPVREALHQLQEQGLAVNIPRRGMFVVSLDEDDVQKINELRLILESEALRLCKTNLTPQGEKRLVSLIGKIERMDPEPFSEAAQHDLDFHHAIWNLTGNEYLEKILISLTAPLFAHAVISKVKRDKMRMVLDSHRPLLEFVRGELQQSAEDVMMAHLRLRWGLGGKFLSV